MKHHIIVVAATFLGALTIGPPPAAAQASSPAHAATAGSGRTWTVPRTPWGDPDLQGLWPANDMQGTPYERPAQFGERATLTPQELAERQAQTVRQEEVDSETVVNTQRAPRGTGTGPPSHWGERGKPSLQASLIVDPPDGRFPPMTADGIRRSKEAYSTYFLDFPDAVTAHPFETFEDLGPYDRCITRGLLPSMLPTAYNMGNQIFQLPGFVIIRNEMIHETRVIPLDGRPHVSAKIQSYMGDSRGHWEGDTLVIEIDELQRKGRHHPQRQHAADEPGDANCGAHRAGRRDDAAVSGDGDRSGDVDASLDCQPAAQISSLSTGCSSTRVTKATTR